MISLKTKEEIKIIQQGGKILANIVETLKDQVKPGLDIFDLDQIAEKLIQDIGGRPAFKNYGDSFNPFPSTICASINEEIVHGRAIAGRPKLKEGDIFSIDIGMEYKGLYTDMAVTVPVGPIEPKAAKLIQITKEALFKGIEQIKPGNHIHDISQAIQNHAEKYGFSVVRELVGHGVGHDVHEDPMIPNFYNPRAKAIKLKPGLVLALEPMTTMGHYAVKTLADGWTVITADKSLAAHYEHTIAVTENGHQILTI